MDERELKIVLRARDEASKTLRGVEDSTNSLTAAFKNNFREAGVMAGAAVAGLGAIAGAAIANAATYEQSRISFESMLGSAEKAQNLLKKVSDFAASTPFELPQVVEGAKRLLAYNISAEKIIPTFKMLGDIAAGVGTDKLPQLITAFGQVQAKGKLMGTELLQFTEAGVGLLDALVKKANENGGMLVTTTKGTKMTAEETAKMNTQLAISKQRMKEATDGGKAQESTLMSLRDKISTYEGKLAKASEGQQTFTSRVKVTREQMQDMISDGKITAQQVEEALGGMTSKGGLFFEGMDRQSKSFSGIMSNIRDEFGRMIRSAAGIDDQGNIREGSLFFVLKQQAEILLPVLKDATPKVAEFFDSFTKNKTAILIVVGAIGGLLVLAIAAAIAAWGPILVVMAAFATIGALIMLAVDGLIGIWKEYGWVVDAVIQLAKQKVGDMGNKIQEMVNGAKEWFGKLPGFLKFALDQMMEMIKAFNPVIRIGMELPDIAKGLGETFKMYAKKNGIPGFAEGTNYAPGGLALVGERGPELVNLPRGSQVFPSQQTQQMLGGGNAVHIDQVVIRQDSDIETLARRIEHYRRTGGRS